ncbi:MAG: glutathione S-transferase family protein [Myxococcales bacterium]|nr:glutathione S-transferase family protein [Myxococcales bacterium]
MSIILYGAPLSPFVRKVDVCLREKGAEFELESVNIMPMPDWFKEISPARRIPVLRDTDHGKEGTPGTIPDSSAICAYLERKFPEPALVPADPYACGRALWLEEYADTELIGQIGMGIFRPIMFARFQGKEPDVATAKKTYAEGLPRPLDYLENEIGDGEYFVGEALSLADVSVACMIVQLELVAGPLDAERWPRLSALVERLKARPSFGPTLAICQKVVTADPIDLRG